MKTKRMWMLIVACLMLFCSVTARADNAPTQAATTYGTGDVLDGIGTGEIYVGDAEPTSRLRATTQQVRGTDMYGYPLSDDFYLYRAILNSSEQVLYDEIASSISQGIATTEFNTQVTADQLKNIVACVILDHPEFFWAETNYKWRGSSSGVVHTLTMNFNMAPEQIPAAKAAVDQATQWILAYASWLENDAQRVKIVHDYLSHTVNYVKGSGFNQSAYGALVGKQCVCAGYGKAFQYLLQKLGIPCASVTGVVPSGSGTERHMWNIAKLDNDYYATDITWDDPYGNPANVYHYTYFNITDNQLWRDHSPDPLCQRLPRAYGTQYGISYFGRYGYGTDFTAYYSDEIMSAAPNPHPVPVETPAPTPEPTPTPQPTFEPVNNKRVADGVWLPPDSEMHLEMSPTDELYLILPKASSSADDGKCAQDILSQFVTLSKSTTLSIRRGNTTVKSTDYIGTGCTLRIEHTTVGDNGLTTELVADVPIIVPGDIMGTGRLSLTQVVAMANALRHPENQTESHLRAADYDGKGGLTLTDIVLVTKALREKTV